LPLLKEHKDDSDVTSDHGSYKFQLSKEAALHMIPSSISMTADLMSSVTEDDDMLCELKDKLATWKLVEFLWGTLPYHLEQKLNSSYDISQVRRFGFELWLKEHIAESTSADMPFFQQIFELLSVGGFSQAAELALKKPAPRLALLLSMASSSTGSREDLKTQIELWHSTGAYDEIDSHSRAVFHTLAGQLYNVGLRVDWKRAIAMSMWYGVSQNHEIPKILQYYDSLLQEGKVRQPLPSYVSEQRYPTRAAHVGFNRGRYKSIIYHLIGLFSNRMYSMETLLEPLGWTHNILDYRLSWHLCSVLFSLDAFPAEGSERLLTHLSLDYASQLDTAGLWQWAVYVALNMFSPSGSDYTHVRQVAVRKLIARNIHNMTETQCKFLIEELQVAPEIIEEELGYQAFSKREYELAATHFTAAKKWGLAHDIVMKHLGCNMILKESDDKLDWLTSFLSSLESSGNTIPNWRRWGSIVLSYCNIINETKILIDHKDAAAVIEELTIEGFGKIAEDAFLLVDRIKDADASGISVCEAFGPAEKFDQWVVCLSFMASRMVPILAEIQRVRGFLKDENTMKDNYSEACQETIAPELSIATALVELPLPTDSVHTVVKKMAGQWVKWRIAERQPIIC